MKKFLSLIVLLFIIPIITFGQGRLYEGPEDPAGDISEEREGYMNGNRAVYYFKNKGVVADVGKFGYNNPRDSKWPNNFSGTRMLDYATPIVFSKVYVKNDSIPVTDLNDIISLKAQGLIDSLFYIQSSWTRFDRNYDGTVAWQFSPVIGYLNRAQDYVAMSNKPDSWPIEGWPSRGFDKKWPGEWNGRFGRGIQYADLESYFVFNDAQDLENILVRNDPDENLISEGPRYQPRPGKFIGDLNPDVSVQVGFPWGGLGLRVSARVFQWNNPEAKDMVFWEYDVSNISDYDLPVSGFGYDFNTAVGDEHLPDDDEGYFAKHLNMVYVWDYDGIGVGGITPGVFGAAYLESPGLAYDEIDNDNDGLTDEKRDNPAGSLIGPYEGITDLTKFLEFYDLEEEDLREHYEGDEDQDWTDGFDANNNGTYSIKNSEGLWVTEPGEQSGDDVGLDGVGPSDINYNGPDEGECNHVPDYLEGEGCEPNFAVTDISESDMLGLTTCRIVPISYRRNNNYFDYNDEANFEYLNSHIFDEYTGGKPEVLNFTVSSSTFPLFKGRTERISIAFLHAYESLTELKSGPDHTAKNLFTLKFTAQLIYEADYRFAQPPVMPTLKATPADGKVILTWDDASVKLTREPFLNNINDFEGYKLYRATDKYFQDSEVVTDNQGAIASKKPIFQCDLIDSSEGNADYGEVGGVEYYLGNNSGIKHYYVDDQVQNGRTYYYALVAYDYGAKDVGDGLSPTENTITMELNEAEEVVRMGKNVAVVTPHQKAAGFEDPSITMLNTTTIGNVSVVPSIFNYSETKPGHTYKVKFNVDTLGYLKKNEKDRSPMDLVIVNNGLSVYDITDENRLVYYENPQTYPLQNIIERNDRTTLLLYSRTDSIHTFFYRGEEILSNSFEGIQLKMKRMNGYLPYEHSLRISENGINNENTGWIVGTSDINIEASKFEYYGFPYEYNIVFTDNESAYVNRLNKRTGINNINGGGGNYLFDQAFSFYVTNQTALELTGKLDTLELVVEDLNENGKYDVLEDKVLVGHTAIQIFGSSSLVSWGGTVFGIDFNTLDSESQLPKPGDIYKYDFSRPFIESDSITFTVNGAVEVEEKSLNEAMKDIKVVPNPYIMTNSMEPAVANKFLNQRRRIIFTHIPADCVIKIYTSSGVFVDKIEVDNVASNGTVHWDLLSREDLEIAAGMYIYHIKSNVTGKEKIGKFAVIK